MTFEHSSNSIHFYTPPNIVEAARATMGAIDLDPASCEEANEVVGARHIWTAERSGLDRPWCFYTFASRDLPEPTKVFLNPPGGKVGKVSAAKVWWEKLCNEWLDGNVEQAIFVCFNLEVLNTTQASPIACLDFPICYLKTRPRFWPPGTPPELRGKSGSPKYPGAVVYVPPCVDGIVASNEGNPKIERFREAFSPLGRVVVPA